jgi:hypothetical protein
MVPFERGSKKGACRGICAAGVVQKPDNHRDKLGGVMDTRGHMCTYVPQKVW